MSLEHKCSVGYSKPFVWVHTCLSRLSASVCALWNITILSCLNAVGVPLVGHPLAKMFQFVSSPWKLVNYSWEAWVCFDNAFVLPHLKSYFLEACVCVSGIRGHELRVLRCLAALYVLCHKGIACSSNCCCVTHSWSCHERRRSSGRHLLDLHLLLHFAWLILAVFSWLLLLGWAGCSDWLLASVKRMADIRLVEHDWWMMLGFSWMLAQLLGGLCHHEGVQFLISPLLLCWTGLGYEGHCSNIASA